MQTKQQMAETIQAKVQSLKDTDTKAIVSNVGTSAKKVTVNPFRRMVDNYIVNTVVNNVRVDGADLTRKYDGPKGLNWELCDRASAETK